MSLPSPTPLRKKGKMIPKDELMFWVENNVKTDGLEIIKVRDAYLWTVGDYERHRLDVFDKHYKDGEGEFCWTNRISEKSFFLHYNTKTNTITDKTTGRVEVKDKRAGLQGIAKGGERIGKSFR